MPYNDRNITEYREELGLSAHRHFPCRLKPTAPVPGFLWIDTSSEAWLTGLVERLAGAAIVLLVSYRPEYRLPWLEHSTVTHMTLPPLLAEESRAMVQAVVRTAPLPERLLQEILAKAGGNPFFLEELTRSVVDPGRQLAVLPVPDTIQAVLAARIDRLAPEEKRLLQIAAVIGTVVPVPLLQAIAERPEDAVQRSLAHLQAAGFLYETRLYPTPEYVFKHVLTHEVAYGSLLVERWRVLHAQIVHAIEQLLPDRLDEQVERLAYHAFRGEVWDKAVSYCRQAGAKAAERFALRDAAVAFEQALVALQYLPDRHATRQLAIDLRFDLRNVLHPLGEFARTLLSGWVRAMYWPVAWPRPDSSASRPLKRLGPRNSRAGRRTRCGSSVTLPGMGSPRRSRWPHSSTARRWPWPRPSACVRCRPIATCASARSMPGPVRRSRAAPRSLQPGHSTVPWRCLSGCSRERQSWHRCVDEAGSIVKIIELLTGIVIEYAH